MRHLEEGALPDDLTADLVFPSSELRKLRGRIEELRGEKADLRKRQKVLRQRHTHGAPPTPCTSSLVRR